MSKIRKIDQVFQARPTLEGAGVHLKRVFGHAEVPTFDPFLLLDDFHSDNPEFYMKGFPWHPHRGIEGEGYFDPDKEKSISRENLVLYSDGENVAIEASEKPLRFLLISGKPIDEPVAWYGPIVMNTEEELKQAFEEYQNGTFIKD
jgi:redox-sensitive bicupin YhaK (pirin superfamily)